VVDHLYLAPEQSYEQRTLGLALIRFELVETVESRKILNCLGLDIDEVLGGKLVLLLQCCRRRSKLERCMCLDLMWRTLVPSSAP